METAAKGVPEKVMGDSKIPPVPPDWKRSRELALALLERSKDLRVVDCLRQAMLGTEGLVGFSDAIALTRGLLEKYWDALHPPAVDPDDGSLDPRRANSFYSLVDRDKVLKQVRTAPLVEVKGLGRFDFVAWEVATGQAPAPTDSEPPTTAIIEGAFAECDLDELRGQAEAVRKTLDDVRSISDLLRAKLGAGGPDGEGAPPDFEPLVAVLEPIEKLLGERLLARGVGTESTDAGDPGAAEPSGPNGEAGAPGGAPAAGVAAPAGSGEIHTREDAIRALDRVCEYFRRHEPSNPIPLLLERAKRLVSKDFFEIIQELAPDGTPQLRKLLGLEEDN